MKIYLIFLFLLSTSLLAKDSIEAIGYGNTENEALKSAYKNAVEEYVGVLVDTKVVIKNSKLIENKILTFSNGYIDSYKKISSKEQMGLWEVKINAIVKEQLIAKKMEMLKIPPKKIENSEQIYAKLATQIKTKFDAEDMLIAFVKKYGTKDIYKELLIPKIDSFELDIDGATRTHVEGLIKFSYVFNYKKYEEIAKELEFLLKAIGGKLVKTYPLPWNPSYYDATRYLHGHIRNVFSVAHMTKDNKRTVNLWLFPKSYKMIYPFINGAFNTTEWDSEYALPNNDILSRYQFEVIASILNKNGGVVWTQHNDNTQYWNNHNKVFTSEDFGIFKKFDDDKIQGLRSYGSRPLLVPPLKENLEMNQEHNEYKVKIKVNDIKDLKQVLIKLKCTWEGNWQ